MDGNAGEPEKKKFINSKLVATPNTVGLTTGKGWDDDVQLVRPVQPGNFKPVATLTSNRPEPNTDSYKSHRKTSET